jgi:protoporphyrinogen oxidase
LKFCFPAVVGGGIGGTSASYFLHELFGPDGAHVDLFEPNKIGGRLSVTDVDGRDYEVGGAVIHPRNKYMVDFLKLLGKSRLIVCISCTFCSQCIHFIYTILELHSKIHILISNLYRCYLQTRVRVQ